MFLMDDPSIRGGYLSYYAKKIHMEPFAFINRCT